ncbi:hypothetical protein BDZ89DRAFT_1079348, partial [Hymenopellis radicata]
GIKVDAAMLKLGHEYTSGCRLCRYDKRGTQDGDSMTRGGSSPDVFDYVFESWLSVALESADEREHPNPHHLILENA